MSKFDFDRAMQFVLKWEGGFVDHPNDPGGATNHGISSRAHNLTYEQVKNMTVEQAKEIYYRDYWVKAGCDKLSWPMNLIVFDTAVNVGLSRSVSWLDPKDITPENYIARRMQHYISLKRLWPDFGRGWMNRVQDLLWEIDLADTDKKADTFHLVQIFQGDKVENFYPIAQTIGTTNDGKPKLMLRIKEDTLLERIKKYCNMG